MRDSDYTQSGENAERDELDRLLDSALGKYGTAEPRAGLEGRVLARLRSEEAIVRKRAAWRWALAAVVAVIAIFVAVAWRPRNHSPVVAGHSFSPATATHAIRELPQQPTQSAKKRLANSRVHRLRHANPVEVASSAPKLDQFPSPQPLSDQEKILVRYVENFPDKARVLAKLRTEELRRDRLEEMKASGFQAQLNSDEE